MVQMIETEINGRWKLLLPKHRADRPQWKIENGGWEPERLAAMADVIGLGDVVYDIGAEEGDFPALWASWGADVVLFEPNPKVWPNMKVIFQANDLEHMVKATWVGFAGDFERPASDDWTRDFVRPEGSSVWPKCANGPVIGDHGFLVLPERPDVPVISIDAMSKVVSPPTVITMDVEGAELTVLRGAREVLTSNRPKVFVSVHIDLPWIDEKYPGDTREKVLEYMDECEYDGTHLATDHEEHWLFLPRKGEQ